MPGGVRRLRRRRTDIRFPPAGQPGQHHGAATQVLHRTRAEQRHDRHRCGIERLLGAEHDGRERVVRNGNVAQISGRFQGCSVRVGAGGVGQPVGKRGSCGTRRSVRHLRWIGGIVVGAKAHGASLGAECFQPTGAVWADKRFEPVLGVVARQQQQQKIIIGRRKSRARRAGRKGIDQIRGRQVDEGIQRNAAICSCPSGVVGLHGRHRLVVWCLCTLSSVRVVVPLLLPIMHRQP
mmetsp:Transcript_22934/g.64981  ORF Transcript_22934/g.64981 Transcript_22934/m.64981 type:complete len:236 (+) Transcript_22934:432-1139(+)